MEPEPPSVESLVIAFQQGDAKALDHLVQRLRAPLLRLATWVLRDPIAAEDVFVDAMVRLLAVVSGFEEPQKFDAYARRTVRNAAVDTIRRRSDRDSLRSLRDTDRLARAQHKSPGGFVEGVAGSRPGPEQELLNGERRARVRAAMDSLREPGRTVVRLFYEEDRSYDQIAEQLDVSTATVKRQLAAARHVLAARLRGLEGERLVS